MGFFSTQQKQFGVFHDFQNIAISPVWEVKCHRFFFPADLCLNKIDPKDHMIEKELNKSSLAANARRGARQNRYPFTKKMALASCVIGVISRIPSTGGFVGSPTNVVWW